MITQQDFSYEGISWKDGGRSRETGVDCAGLAALQGVHLRLVGAPFVLVVHRRADAVTDQAADQTADRGARQTIAGAATRDCRAEQRAATGAEQGA